MPFMLPEPNELGSETLAELPERSFISALDFLPICLPANYPLTRADAMALANHNFAKAGEREDCTLNLPPEAVDFERKSRRTVFSAEWRTPHGH